MKHPAARACQEECGKKPEYIVLELAHDKSIFPEFWPATCPNIVLSLAKNFALLLAASTAFVPDYADETPYAPVENGCVFSAARRGFRAVGQFEIPCGTPWAVACHRVPGD